MLMISSSEKLCWRLIRLTCFSLVLFHGLISGFGDLQAQGLGEIIAEEPIGCEESICKQRLVFSAKRGVQGRSNSGVKHGYLIDYNRLQLWVNPRVGSTLRGITKFGVTVLGDRDSLGFDLVSGMQVDSAWDKSGRLSVL